MITSPPPADLVALRYVFVCVCVWCVCLREIEKKERDRESEMSANLFGKCRKILAIGRNYKLHAEELGNKVRSNAATPALCETVIIAVEDDEHMMVLSCILFISHVACPSSSPHPFLSWCDRLPSSFFLRYQMRPSGSSNRQHRS